MVGAFVTSIAGCANYDAYKHVSVRSQENVLQFAVCTDFTAISMWVTILPKGFVGATTDDYWSASGDVTFTAGDVLTPGESPEEWRTQGWNVYVREDFLPDPDAVVHFHMMDRDEVYGEPPVDAEFVSGDVPEDGNWLRWDGEIATQPC
jgi:hypothetical protein